VNGSSSSRKILVEYGAVIPSRTFAATDQIELGKRGVADQVLDGKDDRLRSGLETW
jgi:hypothetical protein